VFAILLWSCILTSCGQPAATERLSPVPAARLFVCVAPDGHALRLFDGRSPHPTRTMPLGDLVARAPTVDAAGMRCCFLGRATDGTSWRLFVLSLAVPASGPSAPDVAAVRPVAVEATVDGDSAPAWLPDGRIVVSSPNAEEAPALVVVSPDLAADGTLRPAPERITFSGMGARDPCVLRDGRVLYVGSLQGAGDARRPALFTVQADGTGVLLFHAATEGVRYAAPREGPTQGVAFLAGSPGRMRAYVLDARAPQEAARALGHATDGRRIVADGPAHWLLLDARGAIRRVGREGSAPGPAWPAIADLCLASARVRPQGHASRIDPRGTTGLLLCMDARDGVAPSVDRDEQADMREARFVALRAQGPGAWRDLGRVPLEADGSFFATVPADTPLRVDVVDAAGVVLRASRTPIWVRPGEVRGCVGCHEAPDVTPPNRRPEAVLKTPVVPTPAGPRGS